MTLCMDASSRTKTKFHSAILLTPISTLLTIARPPSALAKSGFFSDALGMAGMSSKSNGFYLDLADQISVEFNKTRAPFMLLNGDLKPALAFQRDFENYCLDHDSVDVVSWITSGNSFRARSCRRRIARI